MTNIWNPISTITEFSAKLDRSDQSWKTFFGNSHFVLIFLLSTSGPFSIYDQNGDSLT